MRLLAHNGQRLLHGHFRPYEITFAVSDYRQLDRGPVPTVGDAKLSPGRFLVALTVGHRCNDLVREADATGLTALSLSLLLGGVGVALLLRESGDNVQATDHRVLLGRDAQTFGFLLGRHTSYHALELIGLVGTPVSMCVRGVAVPCAVVLTA